MDTPGKGERGFTLIELSIVLVIIGLIVGGVLVGQDLIRAAGERAQITQIEKYNTAANTFREKYGYLPGDIKDPDASSFGFQPRGTGQGQGDGNGVLQGNNGAGASGDGRVSSAGENAMFWVDLSAAHLIDQTFTTASSVATNCSTASIASCFPTAKISNADYLYTFSAGWYSAPNWNSSGTNYFGISSASSLAYNGVANSTPMLTVQQAYDIDRKMDDGLPQTGNVTAIYLNMNVQPSGYCWAAGGGLEGAFSYNPAITSSPTTPTTNATPSSSTTCYDNGGSAGQVEKYSLAANTKSNVNCALSFRFQ